MSTESLKRYRVKPGRTFGPGGIYKAGDSVSLLPSEAAPFMDKLVMIESGPVDESGNAAPLPPAGLKNELNIPAEPLVGESNINLVDTPSEPQEGEINLAESLTDDEAVSPKKKKGTK